MNERIEKHGLSIAKQLYDLVNDEIMPDTGVEPDRFWKALSGIVADLESKNRALLDRRDELQEKIDRWHRANPAIRAGEYKAFLKRDWIYPARGRAIQGERHQCRCRDHPHRGAATGGAR